MILELCQSVSIIEVSQQRIVMIDWEGLLKFSIKHSDGTKKSQFKEMGVQDRKWLQEAMAHYCGAEVRRMQQILSKIPSLQPQALNNALEQLQQILDSLDKGSVLYKMQGHVTLLRVVFYHTDVASRVTALQILAGANQNDSWVQNQSINTGALELVEKVAAEEGTVRENMMGFISAIIRGENLEAKRIFVSINGLDVIRLMHANCTPKMKHKMYTLLRDLLYYDDRLHYTFNDLTSFSNTGDLTEQVQKKPHSLTYDQNKEVIDNQRPKNAVFKGCIKKYLNQNQQLMKDYLKWLGQQIKIENQ